MKKVITAVTAILIVGFFTVTAFAWGCGGMNRNQMHRNGIHRNGMHGNGMHGNGNYNQSGYNDEAYQSFANDTQDLRSSISADRAELSALMAGTNPDDKRARALSEQISKSENELRSKAQQYSVSAIGGMGYGQGWGCGITGHKHNFAGCW